MLKAQIDPLKGLLTNHITDTNKKIDRLSDRFDKLSDRFDRLYEILLEEKEQK